MAIAEGELLAGRYRIGARLGEHAEVSTFLAADEAEPGHPRVVIKELDLRRAEDWKAVELFEREAAVLKGLRHAHVPAFLDLIRQDQPGAVRLYLVQAHVPGESLARRLAARGRLSEREAIALGLDLAEVLEYLHGLSPPVIHRDIKPSNVVVDPAGRAHLVDFGAARDTLRPLSVTPDTGDTVVGTFGYMPPEQLTGRATPATDLYALGMTLAQLLTGRAPERLRRARGRLDVRALPASPGLRALLAALTDPVPGRRLADARVARAALEAVRDGRPVPATLPRVVSRRPLALAAVLVASALVALAVRGLGPGRDAGPAVIDNSAVCGGGLRPPVVLGGNLVTNPGLDGPCGWVFATFAPPAAHGAGEHGDHFVLRDERDRVWQVIDVSPLAPEIRTGALKVTASASARADVARFTGAPYLWLWAMRTPDDYVYLPPTAPAESTTWGRSQQTWDLPGDTRAIRVQLSVASRAGDFLRAHEAHFDDVSIVVHR